MRWRNVKTGALVDGPDWLDMPQGIYEVVTDDSDVEDVAEQEQAALVSCEEASQEGEPLCVGAQDDADGADGEISSADW